jgi:hypothetical protein
MAANSQCAMPLNRRQDALRRPQNPANSNALVEWCSWLSRQSNTLKVSGSNPGLIILDYYESAVCFFFYLFFTYGSSAVSFVWDKTDSDMHYRSRVSGVHQGSPPMRPAGSGGIPWRAGSRSLSSSYRYAVPFRGSVAVVQRWCARG